MKITTIIITSLILVILLATTFIIFMLSKPAFTMVLCNENNESTSRCFIAELERHYIKYPDISPEVTCKNETAERCYNRYRPQNCNWPSPNIINVINNTQIREMIFTIGECK